MIRFEDVRIHHKILISISLVAFLVLAVVFLSSESIGRRSVMADSFNKLTAIREMKASQIEDYFENINQQLITLSEDLMTISAMKSFQASFASIEQELRPDLDLPGFGVEQLEQYYEEEFLPRLRENSNINEQRSTYLPAAPRARLLQSLFIAANPNAVGEKDRLVRPEAEVTYADIHQKHHPLFRSFLQKFGYYDIFLVDVESGHIVYSVFKEVDFGTSLLSGPHQESGLGHVFRKAAAANYGDYVALNDFEPYAPSYNAQASFVASPIFEGAKKIGVLIFQMPVQRINQIMTNHNQWAAVGLGESGETYIVGADYKLRNQSRFLIEDKEQYLEMLRAAGDPEEVIKKIDNLNSTIGLQNVRTAGAEAALAGDTGQKVFADYRGISVLSAYRPLNIPGVEWVIMSEIDQAEAMEPMRRMRRSTILIFLGMIPFILLSSSLVSRTITKRLDKLLVASEELAAGNLDVALDTGGQDEIGILDSRFQKMQVNIQRLLKKQDETIKALLVSLIPLSDDIAILPLIGNMDVDRVDQVRRNLAKGLQKQFHQVIIMDITGIPSIDQESLFGIVKIAKAAQLMGARTIITGIQPEIAIEITELDMDLQGIQTENSLRRGIEAGMRMVGDKNART